MDIFNKQKIAELEGDVNSLKYSNEAYKLRNEQLEKCEAELKSAKFKIEVMQMLIDDDEAILELLAAKKVKAEEEKKTYIVDWSNASAQAASAQQQAEFNRHGQLCVLGGLGGNAGLGGICLAAAALF